MFSNLGKGSILHGIDKSGKDWHWFSGTIERVTPSIDNPYSQYQISFGQLPAVNLDVVAIIDGKQREFRGIHSNDTIADFGPNTAILADSESALFSHVNSLLKESEESVSEEFIAMHNARIPQCRRVLSEMRPGSAGSSEVKELKEQVSSLQSQLSEALSLLKGETIKKLQSNGSNV